MLLIGSALLRGFRQKCTCFWLSRRLAPHLDCAPHHGGRSDRWARSCPQTAGRSRRCGDRAENPCTAPRARPVAIRVSAGRLQQIADLLNVPVTFFFGGMGTRAKKSEALPSGIAFLQTKGAL